MVNKLNDNFLNNIVGYPFKYRDIYDLISEDERLELIDDLEDFIEDVNEKICSSFDASLGTNWDDLQMCIEECFEELK